MTAHKNRRFKQPDSFFSKILLFGEYSIILNSKALIIPYQHFQGYLTFSKENGHDSNRVLRDLYHYLRRLAENDKLIARYDFERFKKDLDNRLFFKSSIPMGYGLGSSGALSAAIYSKYALDKNNLAPEEGQEAATSSKTSPQHYDEVKKTQTFTAKKLARLRNILSQVESYFHGTSSGLDPLSCYLKVPLYLGNNTDIKMTELASMMLKDDHAIFLLNAGEPKNTGKLVNSFLQKTENAAFKTWMTQQYIPVNNQCVDHFISGNRMNFFDCLTELSTMQMTQFSTLIPERFLEFFNHGIKSQNFLLKLCGAGGGGYMLGFTSHFSSVETFFSREKIDIIPVSCQSFQNNG